MFKRLLDKKIHQHFVKILVSAVFVVFLYIIACSQTYFTSLNTISCEDFGNSIQSIECETEDEYVNDDYSPGTPAKQAKRYLRAKYRVALGQVDFVFVIDNSSSMNKEHQSLARQFSSFLSDIRYLDYRIAITTTDISSSPDNPNRGRNFQDGKFVPIAGRAYIENPQVGSKPSSSLVRSFQQAIVRPETLACDNKLYANSSHAEDDDEYFRTGVRKAKAEPTQRNIVCPSSDERGIYAMNLAIMNSGQKRFFRKGAHLIFVVISDEDERSGRGYIAENPEYEFENGDYPEVLVDQVMNIFGPTKSFSVHSIVTDSSSCLRSQNRDRGSGAGSGRGYIGDEYIRLSEARDQYLSKYRNLLRGSVISICSRDYGSQLSRVARYAGYIRVPMHCSNPKSLQVSIRGREIRLRGHKIEGRTLIIPPNNQIGITDPLDVSIVCEE